MAKIGDTVRFLNSVGGGVIRKIDGNIAYVDEDGFETPVLLREVVVVQEAGDRAAATAVPVQSRNIVSQPTEQRQIVQGVDDKLNIVLAFEPRDIKRLGTTIFDAYIVNDSSYFIYVVYMTRADEADGWSLRYAGIIEPGIQAPVDEFAGTDLTMMDRVAVQIVAYKEESDFKLKAPVAVETALDTTKFFRLHCFTKSVYFDTEVLSLPLVVDDVVRSRMVLDSGRIEAGIRSKKSIDRPRPKKDAPKPKKPGVLEVDLHVNELVDTTAGLSPADMLNLQIDEFRRVMDDNIRNHGLKIVFIHGKGEGVLRKALMKELGHRYKGHSVQDASFREYGFGATQVTIR